MKTTVYELGIIICKLFLVKAQITDNLSFKDSFGQRTAASDPLNLFTINIAYFCLGTGFPNIFTVSLHPIYSIHFISSVIQYSLFLQEQDFSLLTFERGYLVITIDNDNVHTSGDDVVMQL